MSELKGLVSGAIGGGLVALLLRKKIKTAYKRIERSEVTEEKIIRMKPLFAIIHFLGDGDATDIEITKDGITRTVYAGYETVELVANQEVTIRIIKPPPSEIPPIAPTIEIIEIVVE